MAVAAAGAAVLLGAAAVGVAVVGVAVVGVALGGRAGRRAARLLVRCGHARPYERISPGVWSISMVDSWATSPSGQALGIDLHIEPTGSGLRKGLTDAPCASRPRRTPGPGTRLPASRTLAVDLGIALQHRRRRLRRPRRRGLAHRPPGLRHPGGRTPRGGAHAPRPPLAAAPRVACATTCTPADPDLASFPRADWLKAASPRPDLRPERSLSATATPAAAPNCAPPRRLPRPCPRRPHRPRPHRHLRRIPPRPDAARRCAVPSRRAERGSGVVTASTLHWDVLTRTGLRTRPLPFDELGTDPGALDDWGPARGARWGSRVGRRAGGGRAAGVGAALLTPAHQFPMGVPLHPDRRAAAVDWAPHGRPDPGGRLRRRVPLRPPTRRRTAGPRPRPVVYLGTASSPSPPAYASGGWSCPPP